MPVAAREISFQASSHEAAISSAWICLAECNAGQVMTFASPGRVQFTGLATAMSVLTPSSGLVCSSNLSDVTVALQEVYRMVSGFEKMAFCTYGLAVLSEPQPAPCTVLTRPG
jgi:hypothetical protein